LPGPEFSPRPLFRLAQALAHFFSPWPGPSWATILLGLGWVEAFFGPGAGPHLGRKSGPDAQLLTIPAAKSERKMVINDRNNMTIYDTYFVHSWLTRFLMLFTNSSGIDFLFIPKFIFYFIGTE
jgi:hypothetical protein